MQIKDFLSPAVSLFITTRAAIMPGVGGCVSKDCAYGLRFLLLGSAAARAQDAPLTDCDTYAASNVDPQRKALGVPLDKFTARKRYQLA